MILSRSHGLCCIFASFLQTFHLILHGSDDSCRHLPRVIFTFTTATFLNVPDLHWNRCPSMSKFQHIPLANAWLFAVLFGASGRFVDAQRHECVMFVIMWLSYTARAASACTAPNRSSAATSAIPAHASSVPMRMNQKQTKRFLFRVLRRTEGAAVFELLKMFRTLQMSTIWQFNIHSS